MTDIEVPKYPTGNTEDFVCTFTNGQTNAVYDPAEVYAYLHLPSGTIVPYTYGISPALTKDSTGVYRLRLVVSEGRNKLTFKGVSPGVQIVPPTFVFIGAESALD
jgi:hypothetical protein